MWIAVISFKRVIGDTLESRSDARFATGVAIVEKILAVHEISQPAICCFI
jgi:hypothetical protein